MTEINNPKTLTELTAAFSAYEQALETSDVNTLIDMFWDDPRVVRFGARIKERQYGFEQIAAYRTSSRSQPTDSSATKPLEPRSLQNTVITTFGSSFGTANTEYRRDDSDLIGRQTQTWLRTRSGWKIVSAHVSYGT